MKKFNKQYGDSDALKKIIIKLFVQNVKGKKADTTLSNIRHDGRGGHWLETQMGLTHNALNAPDIHGFEMKNDTRSKTTFGDWSADYYIFKDPVHLLNRDKFMIVFGGPNVDGRYSWSGRMCPKIKQYNSHGQILEVDHAGNIFAEYSFKNDLRPGKSIIVPAHLQKEGLVLARWDAKELKIKVESKFNKLGWFKCQKGPDGAYANIVFGDPIDFNRWIEGVRQGKIYFDSGMFTGNSRNYSQWRADNRYWESLISERY